MYNALAKLLADNKTPHGDLLKAEISADVRDEYVYVYTRHGSIALGADGSISTRGPEPFSGVVPTYADAINAVVEHYGNELFAVVTVFGVADKDAIQARELSATFFNNSGRVMRMTYADGRAAYIYALHGNEFGVKTLS